MRDLSGSQIGDYRVDALIGEGGMGAVYRAYDVNLTRPVALKVMHAHLTRQSEFQRRFAQEARAAAGLDHPSIVEIYNFGEKDELLFMVMQFIAGGSLAGHIETLQKNGRKAKLSEILFLLAQVAVALDYAHRRGLIHRDVKPDNILLQRLDSPDRPGEPPLRAVVTDFGLAKLVEGGVKTATGTFMGTLPYMSPEQALGEELDGRSDVYSLGVILYQLATGRLPFEISTPTDAVRKHMHETPPPPATVRPGLPAGVVTIIEKAIAKDPDDRFQSAADMARAMRGVVTDRADEEPTQLPPEEQAVSLLTQLQAADYDEPDQTGEQMPPPQNVDRLVVAHEGATPRSHKLEKPALTIGRHEDNDVVLRAAEVSGQHARLEQTERGWQIVDLDSTNGTYLEGDKLLPNVPEAWEAGQQLRIGSYFLQWQAAMSPEAPGGRSAYAATGVPPEASQARSASGQLSIIANPERVTVAPGARTDVQVTLINYGNTVGKFKLSLEGLPADWVTVPQEAVGLMPGERTELSVSLHPPQESEAEAGEHVFRLIVRSLGDDGEEAVTPAALVVDAFHRFTAEIAPAHVSHGEAVHVSIRNEGNDEAQYTVHGQDPAQAIQFSEQHSVTVAPGEEATVSLTLTAKEQPRVGRGQTLPFAVEVGAGADKERTFHGQLKVPARFSTGCVALVAALTLVLVLGACCVSVLSPGDDNDEPPPAAEEADEAEVEQLQEEVAPASFRMVIADVFTIRGRGIVVTGQIESGIIQEGDDVTIDGPDTNLQTTVSAIEISEEVVEEASAGDNVGLLLSGVDADQVSSGDVVTRSDQN